jgi:AcrR family transcriptional regulator
MRAHDSHVADEGLMGNPGTVPVTTGPATTGRVPANVRVVPAASLGGRTAPAADRDWCEGDVHGGDFAPSTAEAEEGTDAVPSDAGRRPGRPRSERAEQAIIDATIEALGENGIDGVSCEDVASRAGVGKATLYRRWSGKEDLLIAAFAAMRRQLPEPRGESVRDDLVAMLSVVAADIDDPRYAQQFALFHGAGERYPRLVARYRERVVEPRRESIREVLRRGVETGELRPDFDVEVAMLLLTGAVMARGKHDSTPAAPGFVDRAVDELLRGIGADRAGD